MPVQPIDLTAIVAIVMGISVVLIPIIGLTARFALKPTVEALSRVFENRSMGEGMQILERRLALLETQMETLESSMHQLQETTRFDTQLRAGAEPLPKPSAEPPGDEAPWEAEPL
jgi:hypothetical protein